VGRGRSDLALHTALTTVKHQQNIQFKAGHVILTSRSWQVTLLPRKCPSVSKGQLTASKRSKVLLGVGFPETKETLKKKDIKKRVVGFCHLVALFPKVGFFPFFLQYRIL
jgi:hypothetical protein